MNPPPTGHVVCPTCHGAGKHTVYLGMAGDHDGLEHACFTCSGRGHAPRRDKAPEVLTRNVTLADLSRQYVAAAGAAYIRRDDVAATAFRQAADEIDELAARLPPLPAPVNR